MASQQSSFLPSLALVFLIMTTAASLLSTAHGQLRHDFYDQVCPQAMEVIKQKVGEAIELDPRMGASLLRLHFHDCFVNGCDASVLLDDTDTMIGEKTAAPNVNSLRGFVVIDDIKAAVNAACQGNVVSCADIVAVAARESVAMLGGPWYQVQLGRRDGTTASKAEADKDSNLPSPTTASLQQLTSVATSKGLSVRDLVALSGAHTLGYARCTNFRERIHSNGGGVDIDQKFAVALRKDCPTSGGDARLSPLDGTPTRFDTTYFRHLVEGRGLLHSDQQLFTGDNTESSSIVRQYSQDQHAFWEDFKAAMIKMGNIGVITGNGGQIRLDCKRVN